MRVLATPPRLGSREPVARDRIWHRALIAGVRFRAWALGGVFTSGALAVVTREDGAILMVKPRYRAGWGLPGGFLQHDEQPIEALERELREEVGVEDPEATPVAVYVQAGRRHIDHLFTVRVDVDAAPRRRARMELAEAQWFTLDALPPMQPEALLALDVYRGDCA
jgi:ADP-ribose pyrophosphatase YjhB (NUDIX family)